MNKPQSTHSQYLEYLLDSQVTADELFAKAKQIKDSNPSQKKLHDFLEFGHLSNVNKTISDANKIATAPSFKPDEFPAVTVPLS